MLWFGSFLRLLLAVFGTRNLVPLEFAAVLLLRALNVASPVSFRIQPSVPLLSLLLVCELRWALLFEVQLWSSAIILAVELSAVSVLALWSLSSALLLLDFASLLLLSVGACASRILLGF